MIAKNLGSIIFDIAHTPPAARGVQRARPQSCCVHNVVRL
jgi:hypothetical protein